MATAVLFLHGQGLGEARGASRSSLSQGLRMLGSARYYHAQELQNSMAFEQESYNQSVLASLFQWGSIRPGASTSAAGLLMQVLWVEHAGFVQGLRAEEDARVVRVSGHEHSALIAWTLQKDRL